MGFPLSIPEISYNYIIKGYEPILGLKNVSLSDIQSGQIIFIHGPNGSGKSTFLNYIIGKLPNSKPLQLKYSFIPQQPSLGIVPDLSIIENLFYRKIILSNTNLKKGITSQVREDITKICQELGFSELIKRFDHPPIALSGGEQQIINILSVIIAEPELIILDEPTSKLDDINKIKIYSLLITAVKRTKAAIICASHDYEYIDRIADRKIKFELGEKVDDRIIRMPYSPRHVAFLRFNKKKTDLPKKFRNLKNEWWKPAKNSLFSDDYYNGDDSYSGYLAKNSLQRAARTQREINGLINILQLTNNQNQIEILDVPCGWGRHSIELSKIGFNVTAIDLSDDYLSIARDSAREQNLIISFQKGDIRDLSFLVNKYDYIINLWTSFGFFNEEDNDKVIEEFSKVIKTNGKVLIHTDLNPNRIKYGIFDEPNIRKLKNGSYLEVNEYFCAEDNYVYGSWKIKNRNIDHLYRIRIYTELEWSSIAQKYGFKIDSIWGSFDTSHRELNQLSQEFIIILKKI